MSKRLGGFSDRKAPESVTSRVPRPKHLKEITKGLKDKCPPGYDPDIWYLCVLFEDLAEKDGVGLRSGVPVIYIELLSRVERSNIRNLEVPYTTNQIRLMFDKKVYSEAEIVAANLTGPLWRQFVVAMIYEFWSWNGRDANAASEFCKLDVFIDIWEVLTHRFDNIGLLKIYYEMLERQDREEQQEYESRQRDSRRSITR